MYQDILPHQFHNEYNPVPPKDEDIILCYERDQAYLKNDHTFFVYKEVPHNREFTYLFEIDDIHYYLCDIRDLNGITIPVRSFRNFEQKEQGFAGITAWQLYLWMKDNKYCGRCGNPMQKDAKERAMYCPHCHNIVYPKIMPAVIVAVTNDNDELLVTKYAQGSYQKYALIAGFAEIGETIEETVIREVKEETGLDVSDLTYYKCQPWSFSSTLLFGFHAHAHGDQKLRMDENELSVVKWITRNDKEVDPHDDASITAEMIHQYLEGYFK